MASSPPRGSPVAPERAPRGRCAAPVPPEPKARKKEAGKGGACAWRANGVEGAWVADFFSLRWLERTGKKGLLIPESYMDPRKPLSERYAAYTHFRRQLGFGGTLFIPFLWSVGVFVIVLHVAASTSFRAGYFKWDVQCTTADGTDFTLTDYTFKVGWGQYRGVSGDTAGTGNGGISNGSGNGSRLLGEEATEEVWVTMLDEGLEPQLDPSLERHLATLGLSTVPSRDGLGAIDSATAIMGALTFIGHVLGALVLLHLLHKLKRLGDTRWRSSSGVFFVSEQLRVGRGHGNEGVADMEWCAPARHHAHAHCHCCCCVLESRNSSCANSPYGPTCWPSQRSLFQWWRIEHLRTRW